jgi:hypothetical protein
MISREGLIYTHSIDEHRQEIAHHCYGSAASKKLIRRVNGPSIKLTCSFFIFSDESRRNLKLQSFLKISKLQSFSLFFFNDIVYESSLSLLSRF